MLTTIDFWDPFKLLNRDYHDHRSIDGFYTDVWTPPRSNYSVETSDEGLVLSIELPGVKSNDVDVQTTDREIKVSGKRKGKDFQYRYTLSKAYDPSSCTASLQDGVLSLQFSKSEMLKSKKVEIKVG